MAGLTDALSHIPAAVLLGWVIASSLRVGLTNLPERMAWQPPPAALGTAVACYTVGPLVLALYLTVSLNVFRHHRDDASSALRSPHHKNFLRLAIGPTGELTVYPVGIRKVATRFGPPTELARSRLQPLGGTSPFLIEDPVVIRAPRAAERPRS